MDTRCMLRADHGGKVRATAAVHDVLAAIDHESASRERGGGPHRSRLRC